MTYCSISDFSQETGFDTSFKLSQWRQFSCWGGGGVGGRGAGNFLYMAQYGYACRIASFFSPARYMIGPLFFNKKYMNGPIFLDSYVKGPIFFWHPGICTYFSLRDFSRLLILLVLYEFTDICVITSKKWVQKIKGQYMNRSTFWMIKYMNGSIFSEGQVYEWGGFWNTGSHTRTKITPVTPPTPRAFMKCWILFSGKKKEDRNIINLVAHRVVNGNQRQYHI